MSSPSYGYSSNGLQSRGGIYDTFDFPYGNFVCCPSRTLVRFAHSRFLTIQRSARHRIADRPFPAVGDRLWRSDICTFTHKPKCDSHIRRSARCAYRSASKSGSSPKGMDDTPSDHHSNWCTHRDAPDPAEPAHDSAGETLSLHSPTEGRCPGGRSRDRLFGQDPSDWYRARRRCRCCRSQQRSKRPKRRVLVFVKNRIWSRGDGQ